MFLDYKVSYPGKCKADIPKVCLQICPLILTPVCAKNDIGEKKTFSSNCTISIANCLENKGWLSPKET